jgi:hypothetical protein
VDGLSGVIGDGACRKRTMGTERPLSAVPERDKRGRGRHNPAVVPARESDGFIVAVKRGNARGAKEP